MKNWKTIVVGVDLNVEGLDLTRGSRRALRQAEWIAVRNGAAIVLVHSTAGGSTTVRQDGHWSINREGLSAAGQESLHKELARLRGMELAAELVIREERPFIALIREVHERKANLVLLGKHEEELDGSRIGSVAMKTLRQCPCPVWVTKPGTKLAPDKIVAATDLSAVGQQAIEVALDIGNQFDAVVHVVHAYAMPFGERMVAEKEGRQADHEVREKAVAAVTAQVGAVKHENPPALHVGCDSPKRALFEAERRLDPDLFVMGSVSRTGIPGLIVGNTAESVLPKLHSSLLVVKPDSFQSPVISGK